jgi:molybdopterin-containing oxidoreductase family iron-sulfur binding subunit
MEVAVMARWGMVIDLDKCTGCGACSVACRVENNIPTVGDEQVEKGRNLEWMNIIAEQEGHYPEVKTRFIPKPCMHCDDPPCVKVCPVMATYVGEGGIVAQVFNRCIGCRFCMAACPYTAKTFNWADYGSDVESSARKNEDVSVRQKGVVEKCTFCHHRLLKAKDQARFEKRRMRPEEYTTACQDSCPAKAIYFGDLDEHGSEVNKLSESPRAFRLHEEIGTKPKVFYLSEGEKSVDE